MMENYRSKMMKLVIKAKLPSLNEYQDACRANKFRGAKMKADVDETIGWFIRSAMQKGLLKPTDKPCRYRFVWHERTYRRDPDNICSAKKFIFDALQKQGVIPKDSRKYVKGFTDDFEDSDIRLRRGRDRGGLRCEKVLYSTGHMLRL